jgi:hypothetical protein
MRAIQAVASGVVLGGVLAAACSRADAPTSSQQPILTGAAVATDPVIVAAGDLVCGPGTSSSTPCRHAATADLVAAIAPAAVLLLGDIQYESATLNDFNTYYQPTWGAHKPITWPAAGNHEYQTSGAAGYFDYFNGIGAQSGRAGDRGKGYYSFDLGTWHLIALNSNCASVGGCGAGSPQEQWLRADLAAHSNTCTLAYWHHPRFSSGSHGNNSSMQAIWQALYDAGADLVLAGHDHDYERFGPQTATGAADPTAGIRSFVVGVGGKEVRGFGTIRANSERRSSAALGVLKLTLRPTAYDWEFVPIPGHSLTDAGSAACQVAAPPPPPPPPPPPGQTTLTITASADAHTLRDSPYSRYGSRTTLLVDGSPAARTYLKFAVTGIGTRTVVSARLRLYAVDPSDAGGRLHRVPSTSWSESTIRWSNAPPYNSAVLGSIGTVLVNTWYEVDVTGQIGGNGTYSFALESASTNGADYRAREAGTTWAPRLVIVVQ